MREHEEQRSKLLDQLSSIKPVDRESAIAIARDMLQFTEWLERDMVSEEERVKYAIEGELARQGSVNPHIAQ